MIKKIYISSYSLMTIIMSTILIEFFSTISVICHHIDCKSMQFIFILIKIRRHGYNFLQENVQL
jgi:hypothetical protein